MYKIILIRITRQNRNTILGFLNKNYNKTYYYIAFWKFK